MTKARGCVMLKEQLSFYLTLETGFKAREKLVFEIKIICVNFSSNLKKEHQERLKKNANKY